MQKRIIKNIFPALREDIADLTTYRALPTRFVEMIDPFLFLNHHGLQTYPPGNRGLPFGPHPHRGFETVTFILEGDIAHRDSGGHESIIGRQGVQWMTAGRGLVHSEVSSDDFKRKGGPLEILQLWINLPARLKMTAPRYIGLQGAEIPVFETDQGRVRVHLISGKWEGRQGPAKPLTDIAVMTVDLRPEGNFTLTIDPARNIFFYVVRGDIQVNGQWVGKRHLAEFGNEGELLDITASTDAVLLLCHAAPFGEPVVSHGPFVMNTREEIHQAIRDYETGEFGA
ncbi:MAG: nuclease [Herminiimonas sp.]|nr:nuclease [Herminiimonas sp.]